MDEERLTETLKSAKSQAKATMNACRHTIHLLGDAVALIEEFEARRAQEAEHNGRNGYDRDRAAQLG